MFFGPSRLFATIFKTALVSSVKWNEEHKKNVTKLFNIQSEPLFDQIMVNMVMGQMVALKKKARILIPDCCVLIGVPD